MVIQKKKVVLQVDITPVILGTFTQFKEFIDPIDQAEDKKLMIRIRQVIKKHPDVKWRRKKLVYVVDRIISLEFTKKSRGFKETPNFDLEDIEFERRNR